MSAALSTYLHDHLAGAKFASELLERLREAHAHDALGATATKLIKEVGADRDVLVQLCKAVGGGPNAIQEAGAWLAERASRLKLRLSENVELGEFESLEMLALGILGKRKLWTALSEVAASHPELNGIDFAQLMARADSQHDEAERWRLLAAKKALANSCQESAG